MRIRYVAVAAFNALLLASLNSYAVGGGGGGIGGGGGVGGSSPPSVNPSPPSSPSPAPTGGRYPIGAPPSDDSTAAYAFRSGMSVDPPCQQISQEADRVFMDGGLDMDSKVGRLKQLEARARQSGCLQKPSAY